METPGEMQVLSKKRLSAWNLLGKKLTISTKVPVVEDTAFALKEKMNWGPILRKCKYYFELTHNGNTCLSAGHILAIDSEDEADSEQNLAVDPELNHDPIKHSPKSNLAYKAEQEDFQCNPLELSIKSNLSSAHKIDNHSDESETMMENIRKMCHADGERITSCSPSITYTQN
ncbi:hypothetical protein DFH28DRAFT_1185686 [Melampsora americana]|nr:hypothetical protein DFH28DRAFT_1185686 [Melampsora americana]